MNHLSSALATAAGNSSSKEELDSHAAPRCFSTRLQIAAGACVCGGATAFLYTFDPHQHGFYPQCLLYNVTGIYCAGCGATRALHALLHGRVLEALHDNALFIAALPVLLYVAGSHLLKAWTNNRWSPIDIQPNRLVRFAVGAFALMLGFMVLRNLPGPAFACLRPR